jgi:hypothetical protein
MTLAEKPELSPKQAKLSARTVFLLSRRNISGKVNNTHYGVH